MSRAFTVSDLCDRAGDRVVVLEPIFRSFGGRRVFGGRVRTIRCPDDNSLVRRLVAEPGTGQVLVVDGGGWRFNALLGGNFAAQAAENGWVGIVVHGCVRDIDELAQSPLGVLALGAHPRRTEKRGLGEIDVPVAFAGAVIAPGHFLYADADGVIVTDADLLASP